LSYDLLRLSLYSSICFAQIKPKQSAESARALVCRLFLLPPHPIRSLLNEPIECSTCLLSCLLKTERKEKQQQQHTKLFNQNKSQTPFSTEKWFPLY